MKTWNWPLAFVLGGTALVGYLLFRPKKTLKHGGYSVPAYQLEMDRAIEAAIEAGARAEAGGKVSLPATIEGVTWTYQGKPAGFSELDPRLAVLIQRLSHDLAASGFHTAEHMGVLRESTRENTSHREARALDLAGVDTYRVLTHWGTPTLQSLYEWTKKEAREVLHPDFPNASLAKTHKDHLHVEI